jgi:hypothetical protein
VNGSVTDAAPSPSGEKIVEAIPRRSSTNPEPRKSRVRTVIEVSTSSSRVNRDRPVRELRRVNAIR